MQLQQVFLLIGTLSASLVSAGYGNYDGGYDGGSKSGSGDSSYSDPAAFEKACVSTHNLYRSQHQVQPLKWDASIASAAKSHAKKCKFVHSVSIPTLAPAAHC